MKIAVVHDAGTWKATATNKRRTVAEVTGFRSSSEAVEAMEMALAHVRASSEALQRSLDARYNQTTSLQTLERLSDHVRAYLELTLASRNKEPETVAEWISEVLERVLAGEDVTSADVALYRELPQDTRTQIAKAMFTLTTGI